jgi:predicted ABC-type ATPase
MRAELVDDDAAGWANQYGDEFFLKPDTGVGKALATISQWVTGQGYEVGAVNTFLQVADYYLVAQALAVGYTVVTHEVVYSNPVCAPIVQRSSTFLGAKGPTRSIRTPDRQKTDDRLACMTRSKRQPRCIVIAGPNGAGKTTFARQFLPGDARVVHFVNADLIAGGLSPLQPDLAAIAAGRLVLKEIDRLADSHADFAFETTLSGLTYARRLRRWKQGGYRVEIVYLKLRSTHLALRRIAARVRQGGHDVPRTDVVRRFRRGWKNFERVYRPLADSWAMYENSARTPRLLERGP